MTPATRSAMPSERYTPLKPRKWVRVKHRGMRIITFLVTASIRADLAPPPGNVLDQLIGLGLPETEIIFDLLNMTIFISFSRSWMAFVRLGWVIYNLFALRLWLLSPPQSPHILTVEVSFFLLSLLQYIVCSYSLLKYLLKLLGCHAHRSSCVIYHAHIPLRYLICKVYLNYLLLP